MNSSTESNSSSSIDSVAPGILLNANGQRVFFKWHDATHANYNTADNWLLDNRKPKDDATPAFFLLCATLADETERQAAAFLEGDAAYAFEKVNGLLYRIKAQITLYHRTDTRPARIRPRTKAYIKMKKLFGFDTNKHIKWVYYPHQRKWDWATFLSDPSSLNVLSYTNAGKRQYGENHWFWAVWIDLDRSKRPEQRPAPDTSGFSTSEKSARRDACDAIRSLAPANPTACKKNWAYDIISRRRQDDKRPSFSRCSVGKNRWLWVVYDESRVYWETTLWKFSSTCGNCRRQCVTRRGSRQIGHNRRAICPGRCDENTNGTGRGGVWGW